MIKRPAVLLFAALMALCAAAAVPPARAQRIAETCRIVWIAAERAEIPAPVPKPAHKYPAPALRASADQPQVAARLFSPTLYQRPPPTRL